MATNPPAVEWQSQPSIIIDPSIYVADASSDPLRTRVLGALGTMIWATAAGLVISVTVFAITLSNDWLVHGLNHDESHVSLNFAFGQDVAARQQAQPSEATGSLALQRRAMHAAPESAAPRTTPEAELPVQPALAPAPTAFEEQADTIVEIQAALREGRRHLQMRRYDEAEQAFRGILADRPNHPGALSGMARIKLVRGELDPALGLARRAVVVAPAHGVYHAVLADVLRASGESAAADLEYEIAARLSQGGIDRVTEALPANPYTARARASAVRDLAATPVTQLDETRLAPAVVPPTTTPAAVSLPNSDVTEPALDHAHAE